MQTICDLARRNAGITIAFGLTLLATDAAKAQSVLLQNYNVSYFVPTTSLSVEPSLAFKQYWKYAWPFTIMNGAGAVECAGVLQELVVNSSSNRYHFYYRIRTNSGTSAISRFQQNIQGLLVNVAWRKDLKPAGSYFSPTRAGISPFWVLTFAFYQPLSCANGDTPYLLVKSGSPGPAMHPTWIATKTGYSTWLMTWGP
jgi:hypothetical protein